MPRNACCPRSNGGQGASWSTGLASVAAAHAMVYGGPYPSTSDGRSTSVGSMAIQRFLRPVCCQDLPDALLPDALKSANPLGINHRVDRKHLAD